MGPGSIGTLKPFMITIEFTTNEDNTIDIKIDFDVVKIQFKQDI